MATLGDCHELIENIENYKINCAYEVLSDKVRLYKIRLKLKPETISKLNEYGWISNLMENILRQKKKESIESISEKIFF